MPLVIGVFKLRDDGLLGADQLGEFFLSEPGACSGVIDGLSHEGVHGFLIDHLSEFGVIPHDRPVDDFESARRLAGLPGS